jgi:RNA recognition motif-containing protein
MAAVQVSEFSNRKAHATMNIYVGNLPFSYTSDDLERLFGAHGTVSSAQVISDRDTGRSRGFGFVEMDNDEEARAAMSELNGTDVGGRQLTVNEARPRRERSDRNRW